MGRRLIRRGARPLLLAALIAACLSSRGISQSRTCTIEGTVRGVDGSAAAGVTVQLKGAASLESRTDAAGHFAFSGVAAGRYVVRALRAGDLPAMVEADACGNKTPLNLTFANSATASTSAMEFSDNPNFTVAGVTDWTAVGGHGSDATLRTSEDLARETAALQARKNSTMAAGDAGYKKALALRDAGEYGAAREQVRTLLTHSDTAALHRLLGDLDEKLGDPLDAVKEDERAVRLDPSEEDYFAWGSELLVHRAVWQAAEVFRNGAREHPRSARLLTGLGSALFASALYDEAAQRLCEASDLEPADPQPYLFMGQALMAAPAPLPCVGPKLERFARLRPDDSQANYLYAMALVKGTEQPGAGQVESLLKKAVALDPKCSDGFLQLGILAGAKRDNAQAVAYFKDAVEANPQSGEAHYRLAVAYDRMGEAEKAKQEFARHEAIEKQQADAVEAQRREVKQFLVVLQDKPGALTKQ